MYTCVHVYVYKCRHMYNLKHFILYKTSFLFFPSNVSSYPSYVLLKMLMSLPPLSLGQNTGTKDSYSPFLAFTWVLGI